MGVMGVEVLFESRYGQEFLNDGRREGSERNDDVVLDNHYEDDSLEELNAVVIMMAHIQPIDDKADAEPTYDAAALAEAQYINLDLKMQHQKGKIDCDVSWKSRMTKLSDENALLKTQVEYVIQEKENIKLEFQKQFNSNKATRVQHQQEVNESVEHVNQKAYAYADVRAQNQDLLITISELKAKLAEQAKNVNTKFDKSTTL
ncbi:hypothetical protein Tco_0500193 [Tanacetum coccineum]